MTRCLFPAVLGIALFAGSSLAQEDSAASPEGAQLAEDPAHNELRAVRDGLLDAFQKKDIDRMLSYLAQDVVITLQNAETLRGHDEVRKFHQRMSEGPDRLVTNLKSNLEVDDLSILYGGDTAIAFGAMNDQFQLKRGMEFDLHSRWTATLVKQDDGWKVAAFQVSTDMFDNGVSNLMIKWAAIKTGAAAAVIGLVLGVLGTLVCKRRKA